MKSTLKIMYLMLFLLFAANITLNAQQLPQDDDDCEWTASLKDISPANDFSVNIVEYPGNDFYLDPCTNHCFVVNIDSGDNDENPKRFRVICEANGFNHFAYPYGNGTYQATICVGQDAGIPIDLPTPNALAIQVDDVTSNNPGAFGNASLGGGAALIAAITNILTHIKAKLSYDTAICTVVITG